MDLETLQKVASLARLDLPKDQLEEFRSQISKILEYVDQLNSIDCSEVEPNDFVHSEHNVMRSDEIEKSLSNEDALLNSGRTRDGCFRVPQVVDQG